MTFEIAVGGRLRRVVVEPAGPSGSSGGRFHLRLPALDEDSPGREAAAAVADQFVDLDVRPTDLGLSLVETTSGRVIDVAMTELGAGQWLLQSAAFTVTVVVDGRLGHRGADHAGPAGVQFVTAPMPGRVLRVLVQAGDEVQARQGLVVIEAMKMENELTAARAGKVREVPVAAGAAVEAGRLLVVID